MNAVLIERSRNAHVPLFGTSTVIKLYCLPICLVFANAESWHNSFWRRKKPERKHGLEKLPCQNCKGFAYRNQIKVQKPIAYSSSCCANLVLDLDRASHGSLHGFVCALVEMLVLERDMRLRFRDGPRRGRGDCDAIPPLIFLEASE